MGSKSLSHGKTVIFMGPGTELMVMTLQQPSLVCTYCAQSLSCTILFNPLNTQLREES